MNLLFLCCLALAKGGELIPILAPMNLPALYSSWLESTQRPPQQLACQPLWSRKLLLCFRHGPATERRWLTQRDLRERGQSLQQAVNEVKSDLSKKAAHVRVRSVQVDDKGGQYWTLPGREGAVYAALFPQQLMGRLGLSDALLAFPNRGMALIWKSGDSALDTIIAVGVTELFEGESGGVSSMVFQWSPSHRGALFEAKPSKP